MDSNDLVPILYFHYDSNKFLIYSCEIKREKRERSCWQSLDFLGAKSVIAEEGTIASNYLSLYSINSLHLEFVFLSW